jgi:N-acetyl-gamma-glutamyl-phosphate reductase
VSGAGRSPGLGTHFSEVNESVKAYGVEGHRHKAEMLQEMAAAAGAPVAVTFVPHLVPMTRGILATAYLRPRPGVTATDVVGAYRELCAAHPLLRYDSEPPPTKSVTGTNLAALNASVQDGVVVITCAVDNLVRGAGGQGVQAMNIRFGLEPAAGLPVRPTWP